MVRPLNAFWDWRRGSRYEFDQLIRICSRTRRGWRWNGVVDCVMRRQPAVLFRPERMTERPFAASGRTAEMRSLRTRSLNWGIELADSWRYAATVSVGAELTAARVFSAVENVDSGTGNSVSEDWGADLEMEGMKVSVME
jgi:hypothetical protein